MKVEEPFVPSVYSSIQILDLLSQEEYKKSTLTEIAKALSISKTTCLRILKTLSKGGLLNFDDSRKEYYLGTYLVVLGNRAKDINSYLNITISKLHQLTNDLGVTIVLAKSLDWLTLTYVAKEEPKEKVRLTISIGDKFPIISGALGKSFMAFKSPTELNKVLSHFTRDGNLPTYTPRSITNINFYHEGLQHVREHRVSESHEEYIPGISAIAVPIFNTEGEVILSIGAFLPSSSNVNLEPIKSYLVKAANDITNEITGLI